MPWIIAGGSVLGAGIGVLGANNAADAQVEAAKQQAYAARRNMLLQLGIAEPQRNVGYQALGDLAGLYGYSMPGYSSLNQLTATLSPLKSKNVVKALEAGMSFDQIRQMGTLEGALNPKSVKRLTRAGLTMDQIQSLSTGQNLAGAVPATGTPGAPGTQPQAGNMSRFFASPDYQFRQQEGTQAIDRMAAARGGALSGNAVRAQTDYASNLASGEYGNYVNRLMQMAGLGTAANQQASNAGNNYTNALMGTQQATGDARASGILGTTNSIGNAINGGLNSWLMSKYMNGGGSVAPPVYGSMPNIPAPNIPNLYPQNIWGP